MSGNTSATGGYLSPTSTLPLADDELDSVLHDFIVGVTGLDTNLVFPRWQPQPPTMPAPNVNWAAVGITGIDDTSVWPEQFFDGTQLIQREQQTMEVMATFYGPNSNALAATLRSGLTIRQNLDVLSAVSNGIKLNKIGAVTHAPELINSQYIARSDLTFSLIRQIEHNYAILSILSADVTIFTDTNPVPVPREAGVAVWDEFYWDDGSVWQ